MLIGFSTGGGEVARYIGRHGTKRVAKAALVAAVTPLMLKTDANPNGLPKEVFDGLRESFLADRSQFFKDVASGPFFGFNRPGAKISQGMIDLWWLQGMVGGHKNTYECIKAFSETDFTEDLKKFDIPTLIIHGDDDQIVPIDTSGRAAAKLVPYAKLIVYPGAPHGLTHVRYRFFLGAVVNFIGIPFAIPYFAALSQILKADVTAAQAWGALVAYNLAYALPFAVVPIMRALVGEKSGLFFETINNFLNKASSVIMPALLILLGVMLIIDAAYYYVKGVALF